MRHLLSLIAGVVVAPLAWGLLAMGQAGTAATMAAWAASNEFDTTDLVKPGAYLAAAGILFGLVATLRISPLGPLVAGAAYLGLYVGIFIDPFATQDAVPNTWKIFDEPIPLRTPLLNGTLLAIGALLVVAVVSTKRWRAWPAEAAAVAGPAAFEPEPREPGPVVPGLGEPGVPEPAATGAGAPVAGAGVSWPAAAEPVSPVFAAPQPAPTEQRPSPPMPEQRTAPAPETPLAPPAVPPSESPTDAAWPPTPRHAADSDTPGTAPSTSDTDVASPWAAPPRPPERGE
jgi:hypothetical protein